VKEHHSGTDRERIRDEGCDPGRRERGTALETQLKRDEGEPMTGKHDRDDEEEAVALHGSLRPDVAGGIEHPRRDSEAGTTRQEGGSRPGSDAGNEEGAEDPATHLRHRGDLPRGAASGK
jgi:hypothetical protein